MRLSDKLGLVWIGFGALAISGGAYVWGWPFVVGCGVLLLWLCVYSILVYPEP